MANDPETHAAILEDAARLADGGNLEAAADALRSSLEVEFSREVVDVLVMLERAFAGELDCEVAASAVEELAGLELAIEIDVVLDDETVSSADVLKDYVVGSSARGETGPIDAPENSVGAAVEELQGERRTQEVSDVEVVSAGVAEPKSAPPGSSFQTQPRRPVRGRSLGELKNMLSRSGSPPPVEGPELVSKITTVQAPVETEEQGSAATSAGSAAGSSLGPESREFERQPSQGSQARFRGAVPPPPAHRRQSVTPVLGQEVETDPPEAEDEDEFDFFGSVAPSGSHLDVEPELFKDGSLADALAEPAPRSAAPAVLRSQARTPAQGTPAVPDDKEHAQARGAFADMMAAARAEAEMAEAGDRHHATASVATVSTGEHSPVVVPEENASGANQRDARVDAGAPTPSAGSLPVPGAAFKTGRLRPVHDEGKRRQSTTDLLDRVRVLLSRGDLASAKQLVDEVLTTDPGHGDALALSRNINERLTMLRMSALEPMSRMPHPDVSAVASAQLNPRSMFLLSMADGGSSLQDLVDLSGMPAFEASEILLGLIEQGVLRF
ncbi:MAG: hypothetical protein ACJAYU_003168 [Bradymonadia bacterium]